MIDVTIRVVPPSITAQQKRARIVRGKAGKLIPVFFHGRQMRAQQATWESLLQPHQPAEPMSGPLELQIRLVYPHLKATPKRDQDRLIPKVSKPDGGNASKHLEDVLVRMRFIEDDMLVSRLCVEKFHGPEPMVGIRIQIRPFVVPYAGRCPCLTQSPKPPSRKSARSVAKDKKEALENAQTSFETAFKRLMAGPPPELPLFANQSEAIERANADPVVTRLLERLLARGHDTNALIVMGYTESERHALGAWLDEMDAFDARMAADPDGADAAQAEAPEPPAFLTPQPLTVVEIADLVTRCQDEGYRFASETVAAWSPANVAEIRAWLQAVATVKDAKGDALTFEDLPPAPAWVADQPQEPEPVREPVSGDDIEPDTDERDA